MTKQAKVSERQRHGFREEDAAHVRGHESESIAYTSDHDILKRSGFADEWGLVG
jgi:hypothetical protein